MARKDVICVITDHPEIVGVLQRTVVPQFPGYQIEVSSSPLYPSGSNVKLVILEWSLAGFDRGDTYVGRIKEACPGAKVVGFSVLDVADQFKKAGADGFINKAWDTPAIIEKIAGFLK